MEIKQGESVAIVGASGSGKSTLLANLREYFKENDDIVFLKEYDCVLKKNSVLDVFFWLLHGSFLIMVYIVKRIKY